MTLTALYDKAISCHDIIDDPLQRQVLLRLEQLSEALSVLPKPWYLFKPKPVILGYYLYGSVGVGKTFLMDLFYDNVSTPQKMRFHFHHFMQQIDARLRALQGQKNPLKHIAIELAKSARVLCFDEFMVHDVATAMMLAKLLQALFEQGVVLVATSNSCPDDLYLNGLHRERFLPAIAAIKTHCQVIHLAKQHDYRLGRSLAVKTYIVPAGVAATDELRRQFDAMAVHQEKMVTLMVQQRDIPCIDCCEHMVWFDFKVICDLPRSQLDYLEIAERFDTVFVSDIPQLGDNDTIYAILLVHFIDVMYDFGIRLIVSAAVPLSDLYLEGEMSNEFKRTLSRLQEMQSVDFVRRHPHRRLASLQE